MGISNTSGKLMLILLSVFLIQFASSGYAAGSFNHDSTGFKLDKRHKNIPCVTCHIGGGFKHTPVECADCHERYDMIDDGEKPGNHEPTDLSCDVCHIQSSIRTGLVDHNDFNEPCVFCHDGKKTKGQPADHIKSHNQCESCHIANSWREVRYDHKGVVSDCISCHNGRIAKEQPIDHRDSGTACFECHGTLAWLPANTKHRILLKHV